MSSNRTILTLILGSSLLVLCEASRSSLRSEETGFVWIRDDTVTEDGQGVFPERQLIANWTEDCEDWVDTEMRRIMVMTSFEPDILKIERETADKGTWNVEKVYPIGPHKLHIAGDWIKTVKAEIDVGRTNNYVRPASLISHEEQCFRQMAGLPGLVLVGEVSGVEPIKYSMVVDKAYFESIDTIRRTSNTGKTGRKRYLATVEMSETYWSAMARNWDEVLGVVSAILGVAAFFSGRRFYRWWRPVRLTLFLRAVSISQVESGPLSPTSVPKPRG